MAFGNIARILIQSNFKIKQVFILNHVARHFSGASSTKDDYFNKLQSNKILTTDISSAFNDKILEFTNKSKDTISIPVIADRLEEIIKYNIRGGKRIRTTIMLETYRILEKQVNLTPENWEAVQLIAWCVEMVNNIYSTLSSNLQLNFGTSGLMTDDIVDNSAYRRGSLCWYKVPGVGLKAINDSLLLYTSMCMILLNNFADKKYYFEVLELFDKMCLNSYIGQCIDDQLTVNGKPDLTKFNMDTFRRMVTFKTTEYTLFTPIQLVLLLTGRLNEENLSTIRPILEEIGLFFQIQNDYQDCYDDKCNMGKDGNDILQGKCSWLVIKGLEKASPEDKRIIQECYGVNKNGYDKKILDIYNKLDLQSEFRRYEEWSLNMINEKIKKVPKDIPREFFDAIICKFHKRV